MTHGGPRTEWLWSNFPEPIALHDYRYLGTGFRQRERIKRKKQRWTARLHRLPMLERQALLAAIDDAWRIPSRQRQRCTIDSGSTIAGNDDAAGSIAILTDAAGIARSGEGGSSIARNDEGGRHRQL
jgi:hypothetical protein